MISIPGMTIVAGDQTIIDVILILAYTEIGREDIRFRFNFIQSLVILNSQRPLHIQDSAQ
jgi:hypothetical protein